SFTACTLYSWSYLRATLNTSLFSWFYYEILENKLSTFFIPHHSESEYGAELFCLVAAAPFLNAWSIINCIFLFGFVIMVHSLYVQLPWLR
ncbi:MAG TPA: hypothetical protein K8V91_00810, partial [[Clostridium] spiroforme]|nr:hypothetical protein [Thomasclavelia spiroformis]